MEFLLTIFLIGLILYLLMPTIRTWLLRWIVERIQRNVMNATGQNTQNFSQRNQHRGRSASQGEPKNAPKEKMNMDEIEAKRFDKENSDDYVDFEELPK